MRSLGLTDDRIDTRPDSLRESGYLSACVYKIPEAGRIVVNWPIGEPSRRKRFAAVNKHQANETNTTEKEQRGSLARAFTITYELEGESRIPIPNPLLNPSLVLNPSLLLYPREGRQGYREQVNSIVFISPAGHLAEPSAPRLPQVLVVDEPLPRLEPLLPNVFSQVRQREAICFAGRALKPVRRVHRYLHIPAATLSQEDRNIRRFFGKEASTAVEVPV